MGVRSASHWQTILRSLGVLILVVAMISLAGITTASADGPMGSGGGAWNHGNNWNWRGGNGMGGCCWGGNNGWNWFHGNRIGGCCWNWNVGWNWPFTQLASYSYPIYMPSYQQVYIPPYSSTSMTQSYIAQPAQTYVAGASIGIGQSNQQLACNQYRVALQYNTMSDDPTLDQLCGVSGMATGTGAVMPAYPSSGPSGPSSSPYP